MPAAFGEFLERRSSPGVFIVPQSMPLLTAIEGLVMIWAASEAEEWLNRICRLPLSIRNIKPGRPPDPNYSTRGGMLVAACPANTNASFRFRLPGLRGESGGAWRFAC